MFGIGFGFWVGQFLKLLYYMYFNLRNELLLSKDVYEVSIYQAVNQSVNVRP